MSDNNNMTDINDNITENESTEKLDTPVKTVHSDSGSSNYHHHHHHHHHHSKKKKSKKAKITLITIISIVVVSIIIGVIAGFSSNNENNNSQSSSSSNTENTKDTSKVYYVGSSQDNGKIYDYYSVTDAINAWRSTGNASSAVIIRNTTTPSKIYRVGAGRSLETLIAGIKKWDADGQPSATIIVDSGVYITSSNPSDEKDPLLILPKNTNQLNIIGEDKDSTVIKSTTGNYIHPAIMIKGGNVTVKNITFIADHTSNPNFNYRQKEGYNSAYAVHCDGGEVSGVVEFENCNMWSWQSCGLGCGTIMNSHIIVKNCDIRSFAEGYAVDPSPQFANEKEEEEHAKYIHASRGAIVYHSFTKAESESNESFTLIDSIVYAKNGANTVRITGRKPSDDRNDLQIVTFINNVFSNDFELCNNVVVPNGMYLGSNSTGNNVKTVNSIKGTYSLTIK